MFFKIIGFKVFSLKCEVSPQLAEELLTAVRDDNNYHQLAISLCIVLVFSNRSQK